MYKNRFFITWGFIEDYLLTYALNPVRSTILLDLNNSESEVSTQILNFPELRSCDVNICVLPGQEGFTLTNNEIKVNIGGESQNVIRNSTLNTLNHQHQFYDDQYDSQQRFAKFAVPDNPNRGYLRNIALNANFVEKTYDALPDDKPLDSFIFNLLAGVNRACGGLWDFSMIETPYSQTQMAIIDRRCVESSALSVLESDDNPTKFKIEREYLRDFSITTNITNKLASQAYLTSLGSLYGVKTTNAYTYIMYGQNTDFNGNQKIIVDKLKKVEEESKTLNDSLFAEGSTIEIDETGSVSPLVQYVNDAYIYLNSGNRRGNALNSLTTLVNTVNNQTRLDQKPLLPFEVSITTPGVSGINYGNSFTLDSISEGGWLPDRIKENTIFMVTRQTHTINPDGWQTQINSQMRHDKPVLSKFNSDKDFLKEIREDEPLLDETDTQYPKSDVTFQQWNLLPDYSDIPDYIPPVYSGQAVRSEAIFDDDGQLIGYKEYDFLGNEIKPKPLKKTWFGRLLAGQPIFK